MSESTVPTKTLIGEDLASGDIAQTGHELRELIIDDFDHVWVGIQPDHVMVWFEAGMNEACKKQILDAGFTDATVEENPVTIGKSIGWAVSRT